MADTGDGGFSFPALPKPRPLPARVRARGQPALPLQRPGFLAAAPTRPAPPATPLQNPLLAGATVADRTAAGGGAAQPPVAAPAAGLLSGLTLPAGGGLLSSLPSRRKVPFEKGYSQMDWVRLTQTHPDLAGLGPGGRLRRDITLEEVAAHASEDDCWTVLRGKVRCRSLCSIGRTGRHAVGVAHLEAMLQGRQRRCGAPLAGRCSSSAPQSPRPLTRCLPCAPSSAPLSAPTTSHCPCLHSPPRGTIPASPPRQVYNLTPYLRFHPGGVPLLLKVAGKDGTALFNKFHAWVRARSGATVMEGSEPAGSARDAMAPALRHEHPTCIRALMHVPPLPLLLINR